MLWLLDRVVLIRPPTGSEQKALLVIIRPAHVCNRLTISVSICGLLYLHSGHLVDAFI